MAEKEGEGGDDESGDSEARGPREMAAGGLLLVDLSSSNPRYAFACNLRWRSWDLVCADRLGVLAAQNLWFGFGFSRGSCRSGDACLIFGSVFVVSPSSRS